MNSEGCSLPGERKVHKAEHSDCQECDGVWFVKEVDTNVLHLLLVYHSKMQFIVHVITSLGSARTHGACHEDAEGKCLFFFLF